MLKIWSALMISAALAGCTPIDENVPIGGLTEARVITAAPQTSAPPAETEPEPPTFAEVTFAVAGDNLIHSSIYKQAAERASDGGYDFTRAYENAVSLIKADISILNQETLISDAFPPSTYPLFNSPTALGDHMTDIGFNVFTIANNHTLDKGEAGLLACLDYWDTKENVVVAGAYRNAADRDNIRVNEVNGLTFSYLAYTEHLNGLSLPKDSQMIIGGALDIELMTGEVQKAKEISDVCVVSLHWGVEDSDIISGVQRDFAKQLAEAGADIIIGHHPHVLRDIERIEREDGTFALCAYSMGNFISAQSKPQNLIGGVLRFTVTASLIEGEPDYKVPVISGVTLTPVITHYEKGYADLRLYPLSSYTPALAAAHGVNANGRFDYDYILSVLEKNISPEWRDF